MGSKEGRGVQIPAAQVDVLNAGTFHPGDLLFPSVPAEKKELKVQGRLNFYFLEASKCAVICSQPDRKHKQRQLMGYKDPRTKFAPNAFHAFMADVKNYLVG